MRDRRAVGRLRGKEEPQRRIIGLQILGGRLGDLLGRHFFNPVAMEEIEPPVSLCGPFAELQGDAGAVGRVHLALLQDLLLDPFGFLFGNSLFGDFGDRRLHGLQDLFGVLARGNPGHQDQDARIVEGPRLTIDGRGLFGFDQRFVKPPGRIVRENLGEDSPRPETRLRRRPEHDRPPPRRRRFPRGGGARSARRLAAAPRYRSH